MIDFPCFAEKTIPAGNERLDRNPVPWFHMGHPGANLLHHPGKFVTRDQGINGSFEFPVEKMDIRAADTASPHIKGNLPFTRTGIREFLDFEGTRFLNDDGLHLLYLLFPRSGAHAGSAPWYCQSP
jgi:hypothetical protein